MGNQAACCRADGVDGGEIKAGTAAPQALFAPSANVGLDVNSKSKPVAMHQAAMGGPMFENVATRSDWWETYRPVRKALQDFHAESVMKCRRELYTIFDSTDANKDGFLDWDAGEVRTLIRKGFAKYGLPPPPMTEQAWQAVWVKHERDGWKYADFDHVFSFCMLLVKELLELLEGTATPVQVAPEVHVPVRAAELEPAQQKPPQPQQQQLNPSTDWAKWHEAYKQHLTTVQTVLDEWDATHIQGTCNQLFEKTDTNLDGALTWNNSEIRRFIAAIFEAHHVPLPPLTESQWYLLYREFNPEQDCRLKREECANFAKFVHEKIVRRETDWEHMCVGTGMLIPTAALPQAAGPATQNVAPDWRAHYGSGHVERVQTVVDAWDAGHIQGTVDSVFRAVDKDGSGGLEWNNNEIREFVEKIFEAKGLPKPNLPEGIWYQLYRECDHNGNYVMEPAEAIDFAKHVLQRILQLNGVAVAQPVPVVVHAAPVVVRQVVTMQPVVKTVVTRTITPAASVNGAGVPANPLAAGALAPHTHIKPGQLAMETPAR